MAISRLAQRAEGIEIMDAGGYSLREMRSNLADLRFLNRWTRGARLIGREVTALLASVVPSREPLSLLDVATGSADIPLHVAEIAERRGMTLLPIGLDSNSEILSESSRWQRGRARAAQLVREACLVRADARRLPWADGSIDIVICSLFLHHLDSASALRALKEMRRVARVGVVVVDLRRTRAAYGLVWLATHLITRNRLTRHDGPLSVERSFTVDELTSMASEAGLAGAQVRAVGPARMVLRWSARGA
jgi:ubiquinone/menaquinone biosynthesis C-methylase UbiE